jgi:tetratricopeptide (TPR) repeat protein
MPGDNRITPPLPDWPRTESAILSELDYRPLGIELWLTARKARLWSETPSDRRSELFHRKLSDEIRARRRAALIGAPELRDALATMWEMVDRPAHVDDGRLGKACSSVADWAANRGMIQSAMHFAMAGASISLDDAEATNQAALMFRRASDWKRAEQCYPRAVAIALRKRNWTEYICAHIGSAGLLYTRGVNLSKAVAHLGKAARKAHEKGMLWLAGHALHDSMLLLLEREDYEGAESEAKRAEALSRGDRSAASPWTDLQHAGAGIRRAGRWCGLQPLRAVGARDD